MKNNSTLWAAMAIVGAFAYGCTVTVDNNADAGDWFVGGSLNNVGGSSTVGAGGSTASTGGTTTVGAGGTTDTTTTADSGVVGTGGASSTTPDATVQQEAAATTWDFSADCTACLNECDDHESVDGCKQDPACFAAIATLPACVKTSTAEECLSASLGQFQPDSSTGSNAGGFQSCYGGYCELRCPQGTN